LKSSRLPTGADLASAAFISASAISLTIRPQQHSSEAHDNAIPFSNKHPARSDLVEWKLDCVGVGEQSVAVAGIVKRGSPLQSFESLLFSRLRDANN